MAHVSRKIGIQVGTDTHTDLDYADDVILLLGDPHNYSCALADMEEEASKFGLHVSWPKTKVQNLGSVRGATDISVNGHTVGAVDDFIYLGSMQSCHSNSRPECLRRLGITATVMQRLERVWSQQHLSLTTKLHIYSTCVYNQYFLMAPSHGPYFSLNGTS